MCFYASRETVPAFKPLGAHIPQLAVHPQVIQPIGAPRIVPRNSASISSATLLPAPYDPYAG